MLAKNRYSDKNSMFKTLLSRTQPFVLSNLWNFQRFSHLFLQVFCEKLSGLDASSRDRMGTVTFTVPLKSILLITSSFLVQTETKVSMLNSNRPFRVGLSFSQIYLVIHASTGTHQTGTIVIKRHQSEVPGCINEVVLWRHEKFCPFSAFIHLYSLRYFLHKSAS